MKIRNIDGFGFVLALEIVKLFIIKLHKRKYMILPPETGEMHMMQKILVED